MIHKRWLFLLCGLVGLALLVSPVEAKVVTIPNFAMDPSGLDYEIVAIGPTQGLSHNIVAPPELKYGQTSVPDGTPNCLRMTWEPEDPYADAQAGWRLKFLADPDVTNNVLTLSVMPPGGLIPIIPPPPPPGQAFAFVGISSVSVVIADTNGTAITGWGFNADQMGWMNAPPGPLPANDLLAAGGISMFNNVNHTVTINIGQGAAANTATVSGIDPMTGLQFNFAGPNFLIGGVAGNLGLTQAGSLDYYENGNLRGSVQIPGQGQVMGLVNFWDSASLVPEPGTIGLLGFGALLGLGWLGWRFARRRR